jgi:hypothetical protein
MELRSIATTAWLSPLAAILPQTSQALLIVWRIACCQIKERWPARWHIRKER